MQMSSIQWWSTHFPFLKMENFNLIENLNPIKSDNIKQRKEKGEESELGGRIPKLSVEKTSRQPDQRTIYHWSPAQIELIYQ